MNAQEFEQHVRQSVLAIYPKGKVKPASTLNEEEINIPGRFNDTDNFRQFINKNIDAFYIAIPFEKADILLEEFLNTAGNSYLAYVSRCKHYDNDPKDCARIVLLNSANPLDGIKREGSFGNDSELSNEDLLAFFAELQPTYNLRFENIDSDSVAGTVQGDINKAKAKQLATIMFEYNAETANFQADDDVDEEDMDYYDDAPYFINKLAKHLYENKTFHFWWD